jgi:hypothetical protein
MLCIIVKTVLDMSTYTYCSLRILFLIILFIHCIERSLSGYTLPYIWGLVQYVVATLPPDSIIF